MESRKLTATEARKILLDARKDWSGSLKHPEHQIDDAISYVLETSAGLDADGGVSTRTGYRLSDDELCDVVAMLAAHGYID